MQDIQTLIADEIRALEEQAHALTQREAGWLREIAQYVFQAPGKQLRPTLVLLSAGACGGITPQARRGALLVHLLHQASLTHDDVIDEAACRRKRPTVHATWNNKTAVLFGDHLFANILSLVTRHRDYSLLDPIAQTAQIMIEGELLQLEHTRTYSTTETIYWDVIHKKTAHLFGTCLALGAIAANATDTQQVAALRRAGEYLGMAFQLKDDWLDYSPEVLDKSQGVDLQAGLFTLPLLHALRHASVQKKREILHTLERGDKDAQKKWKVMSFVRESPGMDYTRQKMEQYQQKALDALTHLPMSNYRQALTTLARHLV